MNIERVDSVAFLDSLREDWLRLHALDAQASVFTSWWWLRAWADVSPYPWAVLVARDDTGRIAGLFPISPRGSASPLRIDQAREIHTMGDPGADYRGLICDTAVESAVVAAFAEHLARDSKWDRLVLRDVLDDRLTPLLGHLRRCDGSLHIEEHKGSACPLLELPASWEDYVRHALAAASRKTLKKCLRLASERGCRMTTLRDADAAPQLEALLQVAAVRGRNAPEHLQRCRRLFESCIEGACAEISVLWAGEAPIAAQGSFIDHHAKSIGHYLAAYDERFAEISPGRALDGLCIRDAIERGFKAVDFLRGDEAYKHQLGARPRFTRHASITRRRAISRVRLALASLRSRVGI